VRFALGLLRQSLRRVGAESRILVANFPSCCVLGSSAPGFRLFEAVKGINSNADVCGPLQAKSRFDWQQRFYARILELARANGTNSLV